MHFIIYFLIDKALYIFCYLVISVVDTLLEEKTFCQHRQEWLNDEV